MCCVFLKNLPQGTIIDHDYIYSITHFFYEGAVEVSTQFFMSSCYVLLSAFNNLLEL